MPYITVFTPTYNRGYILGVLYKSLCNQTYKDFEWLVVDDGSTDDTSQKLKQWKADGKISINYIFKENGGKHTAHNMATKLAKGELFVICDSDDYFTPEALYKISAAWKSFDKDTSIAGLIGYRGQNDKMPLRGKRFPHEQGSCYLSDIFEQTGMFDTVQIYRTTIMQQFQFPEYKNEKFMPEYFCWRSIDLAGYKVGVLPQILEICEYLDDGLTKNSNGISSVYRNPCGFADYALIMSQGKHGMTKYRWLGKYLFLNSIANRKSNFSIRNIGAVPFYMAFGIKYWVEMVVKE